MSKFKLSYINFENQEIFFTDFSANNNKDTFNTTSNYYTGSTLNTTYYTGSSIVPHTYSFTSDETLSLHENSKNELSFKMLKNITDGTQTILNPLVSLFKTGVRIRLYDKYDDIYDFVIKDISYEIKNKNVIYGYSCQDLFSYKQTRQNSGYEIINDESSEDFIGAQTIDQWTKRITDDCNVVYKYIPITENIFQDTFNNVINTSLDNISGDLEYKPEVKYFLRQILSTDTTISRSIVFAVSNSNAYNALVSLAEQYGLILQINDMPYYEIPSGTTTIQVIKNTNGDWIDISGTLQTVTSQNLIVYPGTFWFKQKKNDSFNGLYYSPNIDIKSLNVSQGGDSLTTVLNVQGPTVGNNNITLIPQIPAFFLNLFGSGDRWNSSKYFSGYYQNLINTTDVSCDILSNISVTGIVGSEVANFTVSTTVPYGYYNNIEVEKSSWISINSSGINIIKYYSSDWTAIANLSDNETLEDYQGQVVTFTVSFDSSLYDDCSINGGTVKITFSRTTDYSEKEFAIMADKIPWLENKIIDISYFYRQGLLNKYEYEKLKDLIYNDLRIANGKLLFQANSYYNLLKNKVEIASSLTNMLDSIHSDFYHCATIKARSTDNTSKLFLSDDSNFRLDYSLLNQKLLNDITTPVIDWEKTLSYYINLYFNTEQRLLKNLYYFRKYWESAIDFDLTQPIDGTIKTKGRFYWVYKDSGIAVLQQQALIIATELSSYWEQAYNASLLCQYFLPESWMPQYDSEDNNLCILGVDGVIKTQIGNTGFTYLPEIAIVTGNNTQSLPKYKWYYSTTPIADSLYSQLDSGFNYYVFRDSFAGNACYSNIVNDALKITNDAPTIYGESLNQNITYYSQVIDTANNKYPLPKWRNLTAVWADRNNSSVNLATADYKYFGGWYQMFIKFLNKGYSAADISSYEMAINEHNAVWDKIHQTYNQIILENNYTSSTATSSELLYDEAYNYFRDLSYPEKNYDLSIIDIYSIQGYTGQRLSVSDQIKLLSSDFYAEQDELKNILQQSLFISDISYDLRNDADIKLTVNTVKYQDKLISRLVKLIK